MTCLDFADVHNNTGEVVPALGARKERRRRVQGRERFFVETSLFLGGTVGSGGVRRHVELEGEVEFGVELLGVGSVMLVAL